LVFPTPSRAIQQQQNAHAKFLWPYHLDGVLEGSTTVPDMELDTSTSLGSTLRSTSSIYRKMQWKAISKQSMVARVHNALEVDVVRQGGVDRRISWWPRSSCAPMSISMLKQRRIG
jgi:hypothetical protein